MLLWLLSEAGVVSHCLTTGETTPLHHFLLCEMGGLTLQGGYREGLRFTMHVNDTALVVASNTDLGQR